MKFLWGFFFWVPLDPGWFGCALMAKAAVGRDHSRGLVSVECGMFWWGFMVTCRLLGLVQGSDSVS